MRMHYILAAVVASLSSSALAEWPALFTGPGNQLDIPSKLAVDSEGNVLVCGYYYQGSNSDFLTIKYDRFGKMKWSRAFGSADSQESANALAIDADGNIYVTGTGKGVGDNDIYTVKYNKDGVEKWVRTFAGPGASYDNPVAISTTAKGKVVISGVGLVGSDTNILTAQYSASGAFEWSAFYSSPGDHSESVNAMAVDPDGNIFLAGRLVGDGNDFGVIKYDRLGNEKWVRKVKGALSEGSDDARAISVDSDGDIVAFGSLQGSNGLSDFFTLKLNQLGQKEWQAKGGVVDSDEIGTSMRVDAFNSVIVTGQRSVSGGSDILTIKYDSAGDKQWTKVYEGFGGSGSTDYAKGLEVDAAGTIFVGVQLGLSDFTCRFAMVKYSSSGQRISVKVNGYTETANSTPITTAIDPVRGKAYMTGTTYNPDSASYDIYTVKY